MSDECEGRGLLKSEEGQQDEQLARDKQGAEAHCHNSRSAGIARCRAVRGGLVVAIALTAFLPAGSADAKAIFRRAPTKLTVSAARAADGTVTATARLTSPNPHCLEAHRFKKLRDGFFHDIGGGLEYPEPAEGGRAIAVPPELGWLSPTSKFGKSSLTWKAVWPGSAVVTVETDVPGQPYSYYKSTVAAAVAVGVGGYIGGRHEEKIYVAKYFKGRQKFKVKCGVAKAEETFVF